MKIHTDELIRWIEREQNSAFKKYRQNADAIAASDLSGALVELGRYLALTEVLYEVQEIEQA